MPLCDIACAFAPPVIPTSATCKAGFSIKKPIRFILIDCTYANSSLLLPPNSPTAIFNQLLNGYNNGLANDINTKIIATNRLDKVDLGKSEEKDESLSGNQTIKMFGTRTATAEDWNYFETSEVITDPLGVKKEGTRLFWEWVHQRGNFQIGAVMTNNQVCYLQKPKQTPTDQDEFAQFTISIEDTAKETSGEQTIQGIKSTFIAKTGFVLSQPILTLTPSQAAALTAFRA
jgi:hypothetical protein